MFMEGCPKPLEEKFYRIQARDMVMRCVLALSAGVQKTLFWDLWHDTSKRDDLMHLMYSRQKLLEYENGRLAKELPGATAFRRMAEALKGVTRVRRIEVADHPSLYLFEVTRRDRPPLFVVWERRDTFTGEHAPPTPSDLAWSSKEAHAVDALGQPVVGTVSSGRLRLPVSVTPIFIEPAP